MVGKETFLRRVGAVCVCACALSIVDTKAVAGSPDGSFVPAKDRAELEARLGAILKDNGVPGIGAVIADRDRIVWTAGIGLADVVAGTPATPDTLFRVPSISKTFVALAALKLAEEGRLDLDALVKSLVVLRQNPFAAAGAPELRGQGGAGVCSRRQRWRNPEGWTAQARPEAPARRLKTRGRTA